MLLKSLGECLQLLSGGLSLLTIRRNRRGLNDWIYEKQQAKT